MYKNTRPSSSTLLILHRSVYSCSSAYWCYELLYVCYQGIYQFHSTQYSAIVCVVLHASLSCVYQCSQLLLRIISTPTINTYCLYITPPHATPTRVAVLSGHPYSVSLSPPALHRHTQPGHRTRTPPQLSNVYLSKPRTWLHRGQPIHKRPSRTSGNWTHQWDKNLHNERTAFSTWLTQKL
jgi:hypothetical protein